MTEVVIDYSPVCAEKKGRGFVRVRFRGARR